MSGCVEKKGNNRWRDGRMRSISSRYSACRHGKTIRSFVPDQKQTDICVWLHTAVISLYVETSGDFDSM